MEFILEHIIVIITGVVNISQYGANITYFKINTLRTANTAVIAKMGMALVKQGLATTLG